LLGANVGNHVRYDDVIHYPLEESLDDFPKYSPIFSSQDPPRLPASLSSLASMISSRRSASRQKH
jgi:hypothetical protein